MALTTIPTTGWVARSGTLADWTTFNPPVEFVHNPTIAWGVTTANSSLVSPAQGFRLSARLWLDETSGIPIAGFALQGSETFTVLVDPRNGTGASASIHIRQNGSTTATNTIKENGAVAKGVPYLFTIDVLGNEVRARLVDEAEHEVIVDETITVTLPNWSTIVQVGVAAHNGGTITNLELGVPTVRAADLVTVAVLPSPSYVRTYYLLQSSTLGAPAVPTANPPAAPWTTTEPGYTAGSTDTLYTVMLTAYGSVTFEYGPVQKSSSYEAAKQAYNLAQAASTAASTAQQTADGKVTVSLNAPVLADGTGKPAGAVWFRRDASNRFIAAWEWIGGAWVTRSIENSMIATLDAAKINTGTISAARIGALSIDASKIRVADFTDYIPDPYFEAMPSSMPRLAGSTVPVTNAGIPTTDRPASIRFAHQVQKTWDIFVQPNGGGFPVAPGDEFYVDAWVAHTGAATAGLALRVWVSATSNPTNGADEGGWAYPAVNVAASTAQDKWVRVQGVVTIPDLCNSGTGVKLPPRYGWAGLGVGNTDGWLIGSWSMRRRAAGELIVDGTITARNLDVEEVFTNEAVIEKARVGVLRAGVIEVDMLAPGFSDDIDLSTNGSFNVLVTSQSALQEQITDVESATASAQSAAATAAADAEHAQTTADAAAATAAAAQAQLDDVTTYYRFTEDGAVIGRTDSALELRLKNDRIEMVESGQVLAYWQGSRMHVVSLVTNEAQLGNHLLSNEIPGQTIWRPI